MQDAGPAKLKQSFPLLLLPPGDPQLLQLCAAGWLRDLRKPHPASIALGPGPTLSRGCPWPGFTRAPGLTLELQPRKVPTGLRGTRRESFARCW